MKMKKRTRTESTKKQVAKSVDIRPASKKEHLMALLREEVGHSVDVQPGKAKRLFGLGAKGFEELFDEPFSHTKAKAVRENGLSRPPRRGPSIAGTEFFSPKAHSGNPLDVKTQVPEPPADLYTYEPVVKKAKTRKLTGSDLRKMVVLPDTHFPLHDPKAMSAVITFLEEFKPDTVVILGDWFDFEAISRWDPVDLDTFTTMEEIHVGTRGLEQVRRAVGDKCEVIFLEGNHEERLAKYMIANCREMYGITDLYRLAKMDVLDIKFIPVKNQPLRYGDVDFIHGSFTNKYHAFKHVDVYRRNIVYGHLHDVQRFSVANPNGEPIMGLSLGCLANKNQKYLKGRPTNWTHALGVFYFSKDGKFTDHVIPIVDGQFVFDGIVYEGVE